MNLDNLQISTSERPITVYKIMKRSPKLRDRYRWISDCWETGNYGMEVGNPNPGYTFYPFPLPDYLSDIYGTIESSGIIHPDTFDREVIHAYDNPVTAKESIKFIENVFFMSHRREILYTDVHVWVLEIPKGIPVYRFPLGHEICASKMTLVRKLTSLEELDEIISNYKQEHESRIQEHGKENR